MASVTKSLRDAAIESGAAEIEIGGEMDVDKFFQYLPWVSIPGGALSYDKPINALSEDPLNLNQLTLGVKRGVYP